MDPILLQKQLRDNTNDLQDFCKELKEWSTDMKRKEESVNNDDDNTEKVFDRTQPQKLFVLFENRLCCRPPIKSGNRKATLVQEMPQIFHRNQTKSKGLIMLRGKNLMLRKNVKRLINAIVSPNLRMSTMRV